MAVSEPKILYTSNIRNQDYAKEIANNVEGYDRMFMISVSVPSELEVLGGVEGVVFVGPQTSQKALAVFDDYVAYFSFLRKTEELSINVAAVIEEGMKLPHDNRGIDYVIETTEGESPRSIAGKLKRFFDNNI